MELKAKKKHSSWGYLSLGAEFGYRKGWDNGNIHFSLLAVWCYLNFKFYTDYSGQNKINDMIVQNQNTTF